MEAARACEPVEDELVAQLLEAALLHADETPHKQWGEPLWLWVFLSASTALFLVGSRAKEMFQNLIEDLFCGYLMSDGYQVYRGYAKRLRCWAHLMRKARGLMECLSPTLQAYGRAVYETLQMLMQAVYQAREGPGGSLREAHQGELDRLQALCEHMSRCPHEQARKLGKELLNDWEAIFRVLDEPHLPLTNNVAERALRHWVILRRISQGTRAEQGSRALALLASVIETCRLRLSSPLRYLREVFARRRQGLKAPGLPPVPATV
jgi:transposase